MASLKGMYCLEAIAIYPLHEGGYKGRNLNRRLSSSLPTFILFALTHLGKQLIARWSFPQKLISDLNTCRQMPYVLWFGLLKPRRVTFLWFSRDAISGNQKSIGSIQIDGREKTLVEACLCIPHEQVLSKAELHLSSSAASTPP
ncbi:hypothetical protein OIU74_024463 [Salix koriyanagi]|uniref:Uncharacterized protein n=1 Tax=Salix koriyanagi TaxID=2511006 RepID=A0A9Q0W803_9ROSI|nr:hypothetical protein OIU74_024463 [Salix koriyanagi]